MTTNISEKSGENCRMIVTEATAEERFGLDSLHFTVVCGEKIAEITTSESSLTERQAMVADMAVGLCVGCANRSSATAEPAIVEWNVVQTF